MFGSSMLWVLIQSVPASMRGISRWTRARSLLQRLAPCPEALALSSQRLTQAEWLLSRYTLRAPRRAEVVRVRAQVGARALVEERPLFTLLPAAPLVVRAQVSEHFVDRIRIGMAATVSADASGAVYRGKVVRIGRVFLPAETDGEEPVRGARTVECVLALDSSGSGTLRIGQNMLVRFQ